MAILQRHFEAVNHATDEAALMRGLLDFASELDFGLVGGALVRGDYDSPALWGRSFGNPPDAYVEVSRDPDVARMDPVLARLKRSPIPVVYDQQFYVDAGRGEFWEMIAQHGYRTGIAMGLRLDGMNFCLGIDRETPLPSAEGARMRMVADLQLMGVHTHMAMTRLFRPPEAANDEPPKLTPRELEALKWSADGKSAWVVGNFMGITERGVHAHVQSAMRKLGVSSKTTALLKAVQIGLIN